MSLRELTNSVMRSLGRKHTAGSVNHHQAMRWFESRRADYEPLVSAVAPYLSNDATVFDVGANIGYFTFLLSEKARLNGSAYLFEPVPALAALCRQTFVGSRLRANVYDFGLGEKETDEFIYVSNDGNLGWNTLVAEKATPDMTKVRIQLLPFDDCGIDVTPALIKIDVEGAEHRVLRGMMGSLRKWNPLPVILCEVAWGPSHPSWQDELAVFGELRSLGYSIRDLHGSRIDEHQINATTDLLFLPERA